MNGVESAWRERYENWHALEHVPERLSVPGIVSATRYIEATSDSTDCRRYLTVYDLTSLRVLDSTGYRSLLDNPSPASQTMRTRLQNVRRFTNRLHEEVGTATAGTWLLMLEIPTGRTVQTTWPWYDKSRFPVGTESQVQIRLLTGQAGGQHPAFGSAEPICDLIHICAHDLAQAQAWLKQCLDTLNSAISNDQPSNQLKESWKNRAPKVSIWRLVQRYPRGTDVNAEFCRPRPLFSPSIQPIGDNHESRSPLPH
jgi:hypothetical protein